MLEYRRSKNDSSENALRVIISGIGFQQMRKQDAPVLDQLVEAWCKEVEEPPAPDHMNNRTPVHTTNLLNLRIWYHPSSQEVPELTVS